MFSFQPLKYLADTDIWNLKQTVWDKTACVYGLLSSTKYVKRHVTFT